MLRRRLLPVYVTAVIVTATAILVVGLSEASLDTLREVPTSGALFAALFLLAELFPIRVYSRTDAGTFTTSAAFGYALLLSTPLPLALLAIALGSIAGDLRWRRPPVRTAFNAAQLTIAFALGALILQLLLGSVSFGPDDEVGVSLVLALIPSGAAMYVTNIVLIGIAISLDAGVRIRAVLNEDFATVDVVAHFMLLGLAPIFVVVTQRAILLAPLVFLTVYAVYRSTQAALQRQYEATHDQLTGLPNRRLLNDRLAILTDAALNDESDLTLMLLDLDHFKEVNDNLGHHVGDRLLQAVGDRLRQVPGTDTVARLGGDEFAIVVSGTRKIDEIEAIAQELLANIQERFVIDDFPLHIGGSLGIATFPVHGRDIEELTQRADAAMYAAKRAGRDYVFAQVERHSVSPGRLSLLNDVHDAIERGEFRLVHQPKIDIATGRVAGFEALVRWDHPTLGMLNPDLFIPMVEHTDLIGPLTRHVMDLALAANGEWHRAGFDLRVAINISARDLQDRRLPDGVREALTKARTAASQLEFEITENAIMADHGRASAVLADLHELGVTLTIDDFGTGYSSLRHLRALPIDTIKIDRSFVGGMERSGADAVIAGSVIQLAHGLGMTVVAEGVERATTLDLLSRHGCDEAQGYLLSKPMCAEDVVPWLRRYEPVRVTSFDPARTIGMTP